MFFRKGKHTKRELIRRLRSEVISWERQNQLQQREMKRLREELRTTTSDLEITKARLKAADAERTQEIPIPSGVAA